MKLTTLLATLVLAAGATAQVTCTFTNFSRPCGADLAGTQISRLPAVQFDVTNAAPASVAILVLGGAQLPRPYPLPGSNCTLLVNPRITLFAPVDARGHATFGLRLPNITAPLTVEVQAVTIALSRNGRTAESSNGITMTCR